MGGVDDLSRFAGQRSLICNVMNGKSASILCNPHPCGHIVYPYTDEAHVTEAVCLFASSGLTQDEAVVLVMTSAHCEPIRKRLEQEGFDLASLEASGQLTCLDAEELLRRFMIDGMPDETLFKNAVGLIINRARASGGNDHPRIVRVFGEMVSLLWGESVAAADRLENLWNDAIETHSVAVLCTYTLDGCSPSAFPEQLLASHSHRLAEA